MTDRFRFEIRDAAGNPLPTDAEFTQSRRRWPLDVVYAVGYIALMLVLIGAFFAAGR